ncbi:MAG: methyltransferase [Deltaproteobacteria bacterium]|nr:methyltransferase [Deltaproteobacteria bacterium]
MTTPPRDASAPDPRDDRFRPPRRPDDWRAPGPAPAGSREAALAVLGEGEDACHLLGDWRIFQKVGGHRWSLDDLVTAWLAVDMLARGALAAPPRRALDLGTGIGSVLLMLAWHLPEARLLGVEAQAVSADLARRSVAWNGVGHRVSVREGDLREVAHGEDAGSYALVTGTPPYWARGDGTESGAVQKGPCRFEHRGGVEDYCAAARRAVADDGLVVLCHAALQGDRLTDAAREAGLDVVREVRVAGREGKPPLVVVAAFRPRLPGAEPPGGERAPAEVFAVRDRAGQWTPAFRALRATMGMPDRPPRRG